MRNKTQPRKYPAQVRAKALAMMKDGKGTTEIATALGVSNNSVRNWRIKGGEVRDTRVADAQTFLRLAKTAVMDGVRAGKVKNLSRADLYVLLALDALEGP